MCPAGDRKKERLLTRKEPGAGEDEPSRTTMDVSLLRARYRSSRDKLRKQTPVLLFRTGDKQLLLPQSGRKCWGLNLVTCARKTLGFQNKSSKFRRLLVEDEIREC